MQAYQVHNTIYASYHFHRPNMLGIQYNNHPSSLHNSDSELKRLFLHKINYIQQYCYASVKQWLGVSRCINLTVNDLVHKYPRWPWVILKSRKEARITNDTKMIALTTMNKDVKMGKAINVCCFLTMTGVFGWQWWGCSCKPCLSETVEANCVPGGYAKKRQFLKLWKSLSPNHTWCVHLSPNQCMCTPTKQLIYYTPFVWQILPVVSFFYLTAVCKLSATVQMTQELFAITHSSTSFHFWAFSQCYNMNPTSSKQLALRG